MGLLDVMYFSKAKVSITFLHSFKSLDIYFSYSFTHHVACNVIKLTSVKKGTFETIEIHGN